MQSESTVAKGFAEGFLSVDLERQIFHCDSYEILPEMLSCLPKDQAVLEAGAGSGRWVIYFHRKGYKIIGIEWSKELCDYAKRVQPDIDMREGDLRSLPFPDRIFGGMLALGSIEHVQEGPLQILREFSRCLSRDGVALITVPYFSPVRRWLLPLGTISRPFRASRLLRFLFGKTPLQKGASTVQAVLKESTNGLWTDVDLAAAGWYFYQYRFRKDQILTYLEEAGFAVERTWVSFAPEGLLHDFGWLAGKFDYQAGKARLSFLGRMLLRVVPRDAVGLMVCCIARKRGSRNTNAEP
jgi:SAM-dependent methyltransferase